MIMKKVLQNDNDNENNIKEKIRKGFNDVRKQNDEKERLLAKIKNFSSSHNKLVSYLFLIGGK